MFGEESDDTKEAGGGYDETEGGKGVASEAEEASMSALFKAMKTGNAGAGRTALKSFMEACYPELGRKAETTEE
jgi:hypothetical protein